MLVTLYHEDVEVRLLGIAQEQVLADHSRCNKAVNVRTGFHCLERLMVDSLVLDSKRIQQIIYPYFFIKPA